MFLLKKEISQFLKDAKATLKEIIAELSKEFSYVSVLGCDTRGKSYYVSRSGAGVQDSNMNERGFVLRLYNGYGYSEYSFSEPDKEKVLAEARRIAAEDVAYLRDKGVVFTQIPVIEEEEMVSSFSSEYEIGMEDMSSEEILKKLKKISDDALAMSDKVVESQVLMGTVNVRKIFLSAKKDLEQSYVFSTGYAVAVVSNGELYRNSFESCSGLCGLELTEELEELSKKCVKTALELLTAERIVPGEYEFICNPDVSGLIAHEAFGHGVEMDMFVKKRAKAVEYMGKPIASKVTNMHDGATATKEVSSYLFDDEGVLGTDTKVIEEGILKSGICDQISALKLGIQPTGNGKRESFQRKAYTRMTNTFFAEGMDSVEEMIASVKSGYLLEGFNSGMEDPKNWGIQCILALGREIVDGKLTGKIVAPVVLTGYVPDLLSSISMVSGGLKLSGAGFCGKGYKEFVKTSTGGPYIKAKGRLG